MNRCPGSFRAIAGRYPGSRGNGGDCLIPPVFAYRKGGHNYIRMSRIVGCDEAPGIDPVHVHFNKEG
jgi:hypothetical protein